MLKNLFALVGVGFLAVKAYELYQEHRDDVSGFLAVPGADKDMVPTASGSPVSEQPRDAFDVSPSL